MKFQWFVCSLLVYSNVIIHIHSQSQPVCLTGDEAKQFNDRLIKEHNKYRSCHGVPPLVTDDALMQDSIEWSEQQAIKDNLEHSPQRETGENLAFQFSSAGVNVLQWNPVKPWYDEIKDYNGGFRKGTGHYTQVVWKTSRKVGCGVCLILDSTKAFATCRYSPPGNIDGQFEENVLPRRSDCDGGNFTSNMPSDTTEGNELRFDSTVRVELLLDSKASMETTIQPTPMSTKYTSYTTWKTTPSRSTKPTIPTMSTITFEPTKPDDPPPTLGWDKENALIMITMSIHAILGLLAVIILSIVVYHFASHYRRL